MVTGNNGSRKAESSISIKWAPYWTIVALTTPTLKTYKSFSVSSLPFFFDHNLLEVTGFF